jgi:dipeptidyl aminopeptidase/acylaminoacyl peptidase
MTYTNVTITTSDNVDLKAWWIEPKNMTDPNSNITLIVLHGFSHSKAWMLDHYGYGFYDSGYRMLFIDSRNRGESPDTELGVTWGIDEKKDLRAAVDFVKAQPSVNDSQIAIFAESQGAATLLFYIAEYNDVAAVIPDSSWSEGKAMIKKAYPMRAGFPWLIFGQITVKLLERHFGFTFEEISPVAIAELITTPTFLIHGDADLDINYEDSQDIYNAIPGTTQKQLWITSGRGHVESYIEPIYFSNIENFIVSIINDVPL